ncbi:unnamed protein product, partial [Prorocentrum cordatum]
ADRALQAAEQDVTHLLPGKEAAGSPANPSPTDKADSDEVDFDADEARPAASPLFAEDAKGTAEQEGSFFPPSLDAAGDAADDGPPDDPLNLFGQAAAGGGRAEPSSEAPAEGAAHGPERGSAEARGSSGSQRRRHSRAASRAFDDLVDPVDGGRMYEEVLSNVDLD